MFRIYPARHSKECGTYDPRERPWYKAAVPSTISNTVKPRHVVILMDTSRSMSDFISDNSNQTKIEYMKEVVGLTLGLLSDKDTVSVIRFGEAAKVVGRLGALPPHLWQAASKNYVNRLIQDVNAIEVMGRSNWMKGFDFAFDLIDNSLEKIIASDSDRCKIENIALLFFSDGGMNLPLGITDAEVVEFFSSRVKSIESKGDFHLHPFLYTLGNDDPFQVAKQISCSSQGYWRPINGETSAANVTSGYQTLFSTPMGTDYFYNYTAWSDPYIFTSTQEPGYTVSALVYNRAVNPARFLGAVGMDVTAEAAQKLYGGTMEETQAAIKLITTGITRSKFNVTCDQQRINLTSCEIQSIRHLAGGDSALCVPSNLTDETKLSEIFDRIDNSTNGTDGFIVADSPLSKADIFDLLNCSDAFIRPCAGVDEYPDDLWMNVDLQGLSYEERVCCEVGTNTVSKKCPKLDEIRYTNLSDTSLFIIIFITLAVIELLGCYFCFYYRKKHKRETEEDGM